MPGSAGCLAVKEGNQVRRWAGGGQRQLLTCSIPRWAMPGCTLAWPRVLPAKLKRASGSGFKVGVSGWGQGTEAGWDLQGQVHLSCLLCPLPQHLHTLLGPEAPALWLAWPQGSWFWSARWRQIQPLRLSGTEMASCYRWVPGQGPRDTSLCPSQAPDPDQTGSQVLRVCSVPAFCMPALPLFSVPVIVVTPCYGQRHRGKAEVCM